jgi:PAS domain S-box-containing protein
MSSQEIADYELLLREVPVAVFLCDTKGKVVFYNAEAEKLWGAKPDPQQNKWCGSLKIFDSVGQPLDADNYPAAVAIRQQRISSDEIRIERPDGSQHSVIPHLKLLFTADGQVKGVLVSLTDIGPLVKQRRKIEESEKLFRDLANSIPNLAWMANADGWIFWYNQSWYEYTGTTQAEMEGWGWQSVHDPKQLPGVLNKWQASIHTGKKFEMIFPIKGADGIFRSFLTRIFPIRDAKGKVIRWFGTNTDIDEQKQLLESLEANLRESEKQIQNILKYAPDAVITIDAKGRILSWNPEAENIFGWVGKEVIGRLLSDIIIPKRLRKAHTMGIKRFLRTGKGTFINSPIEMPALNKQGEEFPVELKISSTKVDGSTIFIGFLRDISVRKKSEEIIEHKTNQLVEAQKLAHIGSWEWNIAEDSIEWSDELYRIFGLTPGQFEVNYKNYLQHIHADDREYVDGILQKASRDLEPFTFVHKILLPDATVRIVSTTGKVVPESEGRILKMSGTVQDVTAQKNYEKKIKESEERFFKIFNNNPVPLSLSEINTGKISYVNSLFCEVFGYSRDEVIGLEAVKLGIIDTEEYQRIAALVLAQLNLKYSGEKLNNLTPEETEGILLKLENSKAMKDFEVRYRRKNGESFEAIVSFEVIRLNNERYTVTSYLDITERKKAEEKLKQQNRQLEQINQELESCKNINSQDQQEPHREIKKIAGRIHDNEKK